MEKVLGIGGLFFRSGDRRKLADWYATNLGVDLASGAWMQLAGPTVFAPFDSDSDYFGRPEQSWMVNFRVADLDAMIRQLEAAGIGVESRVEWNSEVGRFARIHDPDGNPVELWEPSL